MNESFEYTFSPADILYQDDSLIAFNKPAGLLSIPDGYAPELPHVAGVLAPQFGKCWIVHRLDRETSGIIILARSLATHRSLNLQFEHRQVNKQYHALVSAIPAWSEITVDFPLRVNADRKHRTLTATLTGKPAVTGFRILQQYPGGCLVEASPHTGYTHQIRAHLAAIGLPILGDVQYFGIRPEPAFPKLVTSPGTDLISRVALHARSISFSHPVTGLPIYLESPYPVDFQQALAALES
jgi:RluA family pseudouridine synthase